MPSRRPIRRPTATLAQTPLPVTPYPSRDLWRLHETGMGAVHFMLHPAHRFSHPACPFPVLYLAEDLATCIWERFGDDILNEGSPVSLGLWRSRSASRVRVPDLRLCDLTDAHTATRAKVDLGALTSQDLAIPMEWGLRIQEHPAAFDGLRYRSRFNHEPCLVLFNRDGMASRLHATPVGNLPDMPEADDFLRHHHVALI